MTKVEIVGFKSLKFEKVCLIFLVILLLLLSTSVIAPGRITRQGYKQDLYEKCAVTCGSPETCRNLSGGGIWTLALGVELCECMNERSNLTYCCNKLKLDCG